MDKLSRIHLVVSRILGIGNKSTLPGVRILFTSRRRIAYAGITAIRRDDMKICREIAKLEGEEGEYKFKFRLKSIRTINEWDMHMLKRAERELRK